MEITTIRRAVDGLPHMSFEQGKIITGIILDNRFQNLLELGFRHGVSTCYMAGALDTLAGGRITTIDLLTARQIQPNVEQLLGQLDLRRYVDVFYEPHSYIWRLMKMLEDDPSPRFDLCYIDGAHDWFTDGFAFFLVDRLLTPGGLIIFDDLDWTYEGSPALGKSDAVRRMPEDERRTAQVRKVYELLVKRHPNYVEFKEQDGWAYARKSRLIEQGAEGEARREVVFQKQYIGLGGALLTLARRLVRR